MTDIVSPLQHDFMPMSTDNLQDFGYLVDDSETDTSVAEASSGFSSNEDDDISLLGDMDFGSDDLVDFEGTSNSFPNAIAPFAPVQQPLPCQQVPQSYRLQYPDGTVHDLSARLGPLACSVEEWSSYGLDQNTWYPFAQDAATSFTDNQALTARLVHALSSSPAVTRFWDPTATAMIFVLPSYAQRSDSVRRVKKFYAQGIELEPLVRSCKADADQGLWQRYLRISSRDAVGLMSAASRGDWLMISDFLEHYLATTEQAEQHWTIYDSSDGVTNVHFDAVASVGPIAPLQPPRMPGWTGGLHLRGAKAVVEKYHSRGTCQHWSSEDEEADKGSEAATTSGEDESDSSGGEESDHDDHDDHEEDEDENAYNSPGPREPLGSDLPDRGRHMCRAEGCTRYYRWPDYFCGVHGGGRCHYMHWVEGVEPCGKFHQSKNSKGELLCGKHSRLINARYGEEKRKPPKSTRSGTNKAATKAKKRPSSSSKTTKKAHGGKTSARR